MQAVCLSKLETETLWEGVLAEGLYVAVFFVIILVINRIGKFPILCTCKIHYMILKMFTISFFKSVAVLIGNGIVAISCVLHGIPILQIAGFLVFTSTCGVNGNILNAATVSIYPTALRCCSQFYQYHECFQTNFYV